MKEWATAKSIKRDIADVTDKYLELFGVYMPQHTRKYGEGVTGTLIFRTRKVLECIDNEVKFPVSDNPEGYGPHEPERQTPMPFVREEAKR